MSRSSRTGSLTELPGGLLRWRARWYEIATDGERHVQRSRCFATKDEATVFLQRVGAALQKTAPTVLDRFQGVPGRLDDLIPLHYQEMIEYPLHRGTCNSTQNTLRRFQSEEGVTFLHDIDVVKLLNFAKRNYVRCADRGRQRIHQIQRFLRKYKLRKYRVDDSAIQPIFKELGKAAPPKRNNVFSQAQLGAIIEEMKVAPRDRASYAHLPRRERTAITIEETVYHEKRLAFAPMFLFLLRYPLRPISVCRLNVADWNSAERVLRVRGEVNKNGVEQVLRIDSAVAQLIDGEIDGRTGDVPIFRTRPGVYGERRRWTPDDMYLLMRDVLHRARVPGAEGPIAGSLYWLKHTGCTYLMLEHRGDIRLVSHYTGHKNPLQLMKYVLIPQERTDVIAHCYDRLNDASDDPCSGADIVRFAAQRDATGTDLRIIGGSLATRDVVTGDEGDGHDDNDAEGAVTTSA